MGEHLPCKQGVKSSNLFISTIVGAETGPYDSNRKGKRAATIPGAGTILIMGKPKVKKR